MRSSFQRLISLVLIAAMLFSLGCEAFAETLTLPAALETIDEEAFFGDSSLDEVVIPYGATSIGPRAFADSGVKRITIPETVTEIAEDAFAWTDYLTVISPENSYAQKYAEELGFLWESSNTLYRRDLLNAMLTSLDAEEGEDDSLLLEELDFSSISSEGVTNSYDLELIKQYNALQEELSSMVEDYQAAMDEIGSSLESALDVLADNGFSITEDSVEFRGASYSAILSDDAGLPLIDDYEILSSTVSEDGSLTMELFCEGKQYTLIGDSRGYTLQEISDNVLYSMRSNSIIVPNSGDGNPNGITADDILEFVDLINNSVEIVNASLEEAEALVNTMLNKLEEQLRIIKAKPSSMEWLNKLLVSSAESEIKYLRTVTLPALKLAIEIVNPLDTVLAGSQLANDYASLTILFNYEAHGHPTDVDLSTPEQAEIARQMAENIRVAETVYGYDLASTLIMVCMELCKIGKVIGTLTKKLPILERIVQRLRITENIQKQLNRILRWWGVANILPVTAADRMREEVIQADLRLHGAIRGVVRDENGLPLADVYVSVKGGAYTRTDQYGRYLVYSTDGTQKLCFSKTGYNPEEVDVVVSYSRSTQQDMTLKIPSAIYRGTVINKKTKKPIPGVQIVIDNNYKQETNSRGEFRFDMLTPGQHTAVFTKKRFVALSQEIDLTSYTPGMMSPALHRVEMEEASYVAAFTGTVVDDSTGAPIYGVDVVLDGVRETITGTDGKYCFYEVEQGEHTLTLSKNGYKGIVAIITIDASAKPYNVRLKSDIISSDLSGTVTDSKTGAALAGVKVTLDGTQSVYTDAEGKYSFADLSLAAHTLSFEKPYYNKLSASITITQPGSTSYNARMVPQEEETISQDSFDPNFWAWCVERYDSNHDGKLSRDEALGVRGMDCRDKGFTSLKGIKHFSNLKELSCGKNQLTSLDVSGLSSLTYLDCSDNQLTSLDVSGCSALTGLYCSNNQLTSLDASGCPALTSLRCDGNQLTSLDVSGCSALTYLGCYGNQLASLDVSDCDALTDLSCSDTQLTSLDVSGCSALTYLGCSDTQLTSLDVSGCSALTYLGCYGNQLASLDVSDCDALTELDCSDNPLTNLNVSGCSALKYLRCENTQLISLNVSGCTALNYVTCSNNPQLTDINASGCSALINLTNNHAPNLTNVDVSNCSSLIGLGFFDNEQLANLNASGCSALSNLNIYYNNQLKSLNLSGCSLLSSLSCDDNLLTNLNVSGCSALTSLGCYNNQLTSLGVSGCSALTTLSCFNNQLTNLDISTCPALTSLSCGNNQLTSLDISGLSSLTSLSCYNNQLTSLIVSNCSELATLECRKNHLTSLDVSGCPKLTDENLRCDAGVTIIR